MGETTKEKIKKVALGIFASKGYEATTMNEIADGVGIRKPSLYDHFPSKVEIFLAVYTDLSNKYKAVVSAMCDEAKSMETENALYYVFEKYITYFTDNPEKSHFWNRALIFTPSAVYDKVFQIAKDSDAGYHIFLEETIKAGIKKGSIKKAKIDDMMLSYGCLRSGLITFLLVNPGIKKDRIRVVWEDYWIGIKAKG